MARVHHLPIMGSDLPDGTLPAPAWADAPGEAPARLLQVGDLARICGKTVRAIHHYENLGLLRPHARSKGRYRLYADDAVARVKWIGKLHELGMTLTEIQDILGLWEQAATAPEAMGKIRAVYVDKLAQVRNQIATLSSLERELCASLEYLYTCDSCGPTEPLAACNACPVHHEDQPEPELVSGIHAGYTS